MRNPLSWLLVALMLALAGPAVAQSDNARASESMIVVPSPGADLWKNIRQAQSGQSQIQGVEPGVLINASGDDWREFRMCPTAAGSSVEC